MAMKKGTFSGANVFLSRNLVQSELFDAVHDALRLNGAQVFLCCDPSRNSPDDYHVISSLDHEKFGDLRSKGCNLLGPQCVLSCAKEHRDLPKQGYTCCLAMDGVKVLLAGFETSEKVKLEQLVTAMGGILHAKASLDVNFVIVKNVLAANYKWALKHLKKPLVNMSWLDQCWIEHRVVPQEPYRVLPFTGLTICVTRIHLDERKAIENLILKNGGCYSADLTRKCTHLVSDAPVGDKYMVARRWGNIHLVTRNWIDQSILRRACLDEACYPVRLPPPASNNTKKPHKVHCYVDKSNETLHPASSVTVTKDHLDIPPKVTEDVEATLSQNVSSSFKDVNKADNEGIDAPTIIVNDGTKFDCPVAEDSEAEDNDLYLSNCRIFLVGFDEKELSKLVTMIRKGGGTRHMLLSERLTHIVIGTPSEIEKKEVRRLAAWGVIDVVRTTWLEECHHAKKELSVSPRHTVSELLLSKDSAFYRMEPTIPHVPYLSMDQEMASMKSGAKLLLEKKRVNGENKSRCKLQPSSDTRSQSNIFKGKSFCFSSSFPTDRKTQIVEWIRQGGGMMVDDRGTMKAHFIVECHGLLQSPAVVSQATVVSTHWIRSSLEEGCMQDIRSHILYSPLRCHIPLPGFEGLRFCVSQYEEKDRTLLRNLCFTLGSKFTEKLSKKITHLLCKFTSGPKYEAACKWGIQSVTIDWISECIAQDTVVSIDPFQPKVATAQDREAGLCTLSQFPTQAAHMVSGYESQGPTDTPNHHIGVARGDCGKEAATSNAYGKRLTSLVCDGDTSKKNRRQENLTGGTNFDSDKVEATGVVEAIDCLLAQSNVIQDMKSPGKPDGEMNFSPDHSIFGHNHANTHATFGISSHWLGRNQKPDNTSDAAISDVINPRGPYDFSETQTDSQVVGYEEDLSGRQKIIDRVRSQSMASTPDI